MTSQHLLHVAERKERCPERRDYLIMRSSAPAGELGRVGDPGLEAVGAECAKADGHCSVDGADAPICG